MKTGIIGVGSMGKNHARVNSEMGFLAGIADSDEATARPLAERFDVVYYSDYKDMLDNVDAVTVATPTVTHFKISMDAINAGKHVLVEKPICPTLDESQKLVEAAEKAGVILAVGQIERHNPVVKFARESIEQGMFGEIVSISARRVSSFPGRIRDVGVLLDLGIHDIDVIRYLANSPVKSVYSLGGKRQNDKFEDHANIMMEFQNGILGFVEVNWLTPMKVRKLSITGLQNYVELDYIKQSADISSSEVSGKLDMTDLYHLPIEFDIRHVSLKKQEPLRNEHEDFVRAIKGNGQPLVSGRDGMETLRVCQAALESIQEKKRVTLE